MRRQVASTKIRIQKQGFHIVVFPKEAANPDPPFGRSWSKWTEIHVVRKTIGMLELLMLLRVQRSYILTSIVTITTSSVVPFRILPWLQDLPLDDFIRCIDGVKAEVSQT